MMIPLNQFRATDAFEYVDAYRSAVELPSADRVREAKEDLNARMGTLAATGREIPSYLLAAYRGYEDALVFLTNGIPPNVVKLDDREPLAESA